MSNSAALSLCQFLSVCCDTSGCPFLLLPSERESSARVVPWRLHSCDAVIIDQAKKSFRFPRSVVYVSILDKLLYLCKGFMQNSFIPHQFLLSYPLC